MTELERLRALLEDAPQSHVERTIIAADSGDVYLAAGPVVPGSVALTLNGTAMTEDLDFTVLDGERIRFTGGPPADADLLVTYRRHTFPDTELVAYLAEAAQDWAASDTRAYAAAVRALDTLLTGLALAQNFGSADGSFDLASAYDRLSAHRARLTAQLAEWAKRPGVLEPADAS